MIRSTRYLFLSITFLGIAALIFSACTKERNYEYKASTERTLLIYLAGDNSLSSILNQELETYRTAWAERGTNCVIYTDPGNAAPCLLLLRKDNQGNNTILDTLQKFEEQNSASAATLRSVIDYTTSKFPAKSYGLIFSSHASGWLPEHTLSYGRYISSLGADFAGPGVSQRGSEIELIDFASAIKDKQFSFIIFNACFMGGVEVAYELRNKTDYILASSAEILEDGFMPTLPFTFTNLLTSSTDVFENLLNFGTSYLLHTMQQSGAQQSTTLSIIKTSELDNLAAWMKLNTSLNSNNEDITDIQYFDRPGVYGETIIKPRFFDLQHIVEKRVNNSQLQEFNDLINKTVLWKGNTPWLFQGYGGIEVKHHSGLSMYLFQPELQDLNASYKKLAWYINTRP